MSRSDAMARIMVLTGGRAAEEVIFNEITSGAANDIEQATRLARAMVTRMGMSDNFGMMALDTVNNPYLGGDASTACSSDTSSKVDEEVRQIIRTCHEKARSILTEHKDKLDELTEFLIEKETITGKQFLDMMNVEADELPVVE